MEPSNRWAIPTLLICTFGFVKELRPVEPFLTPFLASKNLTEDEIESQIYPFWTYSYMAALIPVFILTDLVRYKPVIVAEGLALIGSGMLMIFTDTVGLMRLMQCFYGVATAADIGYFAYLYAVVPVEHYQAVSSYTRSAYLAGGFLSSVLAQVFVTYDILSYASLNIFGTVSVTVATVISLFLPRAKKSLFFHQTLTNEEEEEEEEQQAVKKDGDPIRVGASSGKESTEDDSLGSSDPGTNGTASCHDKSPVQIDEDRDISHSERPDCLAGRSDQDSSPKELPCIGDCQGSESTSDPGAGHLAICRGLMREFRVAFSDWRLLQWSLWWSIATCGFYQVGNYVQNLWDLIGEGQDNELYYGAVEALSLLLGSLSSFFIMYAKANWDVYGELLMGLVSLLDCALLVVMGLTSNIWVAYLNYIVFRSSYQLLITIASFQIAKFLTIERYALVFGWNTFIALVLQSILTLVVVDSHGLNLPADTQFVIYGSYFGVLGGAFLVKASVILYKMCRQRRTTQEQGHSVNDSSI